MKKLLLIIAAWLFFTGCQYPTSRFFATDYTRYNEHGFFVSPLENIEGYKFLPISSIMLQESSMKDQYTDLMLDKLVGYAKTKGADGLIGVKFNEISIYFRNVSWPIWRAEGIAVKFIDGSPATGKPLAVYDYEAARKFTNETQKPLTKRQDGESGREIIYYDPASNSYLNRNEFITKYGSITCKRLEQMEQNGLERGEKPIDYDAGKWDY